MQGLTQLVAAAPGGRIAVHLGDAPEREHVVALIVAAGKRVVTLDDAPDVIVTADGVVENGFVRPLKDEVDEAVPDASLVIVLRLLGDVPLGPTYDVYLDVPMTPGRDVYVGASG